MQKIEVAAYKNLIKWSKSQFSELPWRVKRTPYSTWVSEVMLQQTTVSTVKERFTAFIKKYPTIKSLSSANEDDVLKMWEGLGYYRRARNLHAGSTQLKEHKYQLPDSFKELKKIKGIGEYTAKAILAFAFKQNSLPLDVNVQRVLSRIYEIESINCSELENQFIKAKVSIPDLSEALMDCGRIYCQKKKTDCMLCPLGSICKARKNGTVSAYPVLANKGKTSNSLVLERVIYNRAGKIALVQREKGKWLEGQWELPTYILESQQDLTQYPMRDKQQGEFLFSIRSVITHHKIENRVTKVTSKKREWKLVQERDLSNYILSSVTSKILSKYL